MLVTPTAKADLDIDRIEMLSTKGFHDGVPESLSPWVVDIYANLADAGDLDHIDITKPGESIPFATMSQSDNPGQWEYLSPEEYATLSSLRDGYPEGTYKFDFRSSSGMLLRTVLLDHSDLPDEPANPVEFTYPADPDQAGVNPYPTFTWNVNRSDGDTLMMAIDNSDPGGDIYFDAPVSMNTTSWKPGPLSVDSEYSLWVSVCNVKDWGKGKPTFPTMTVDGDEFQYSLMVEYFNEIRFTTAIIDIVPDTISTRTKSITCHIWPLDGYDVTQIDPDSIRLNDIIQPVRISVKRKKQMLVVKFPTSGLSLVPGPLELTVSGELTDETTFEDSDSVAVVKKGGKPS